MFGVVTTNMNIPVENLVSKLKNIQNLDPMEIGPYNTKASAAILCYQIKNTFDTYAQLKSATNVLRDEKLFRDIEFKLTEINKIREDIVKALTKGNTKYIHEDLLPNGKILIAEAMEMITNIKIILNGVETSMIQANNDAMWTMQYGGLAAGLNIANIAFNTLSPPLLALNVAMALGELSLVYINYEAYYLTNQRLDEILAKRSYLNQLDNYIKHELKKYR